MVHCFAEKFGGEDMLANLLRYYFGERKFGKVLLAKQICNGCKQLADFSLTKAVHYQIHQTFFSLNILPTKLSCYIV